MKQSILLYNLNSNIFFILMTIFMMNSMRFLLIPFHYVLSSLNNEETVEVVGINLTHK